MQEHQGLPGEIVHRNIGGVARLVRELPGGIAWQVFDAGDLGGLESVESVKAEIQGVEIVYREGTTGCTLAFLRAALVPGGSAGLGRVAGFAHEITRQLLQAHAQGVPQLVITPDKIGLGSTGFVLLPSLAPVRLARLDALLGGRRTNWVHYSAPEVLRWRGCPPGGNAAALADIYSLGCLIAAVCDPAWDAEQQDAFAVAKTRVEQARSSWPWHLSPNLHALGEILTSLCRHRPKERLPLEKAREQLKALHEANSPAHVAARLAGDAEGLAHLITDVESLAASFPVDTHWLALVKADQALARTPPDFSLALACIEAGGKMLLLKSAAHLRIARAHAARRRDSSDLDRCMAAYAMAAALSDSDKDAVITEWEQFLEKIEDPATLTALTGQIDVANRPPVLVRARVNACLRAGKPYEGWTELATCLQRLPPGDPMTGFAREVVASVPPDMLTRWLAQVRELPRMAAARAIACERLGMTDLAQKNHAEHAALFATPNPT